MIAGGSGALGHAVAELLSDLGHSVAILDSERALARHLTELALLGDRARGYSADLATGEAWTAVLPRIEAELGPVGNAVLVAGAYAGNGGSDSAADERVYREMLRTNLDTAFLGLQQLVPRIAATGGGAVVVIGSRNAERPWDGAAAVAYTAAKSGLVALAQALAAGARESKVRINAVLPSTLDTPANRASMPGADPERWVSVVSCARVIAFLLSDDARDISGAALPVYGRA